VLALSVQRARHWQALKEEAKHHALRDLAFLRRLLLEIGVRTSLGERVFELTPAEVERLADPVFCAQDAAALVAERCDAREALLSVNLPATLTVEDLEDLDLEKGGLIPRGMRTGAVQGTRVSGRGGITGRARVLRHPEEIAAFRDGEILVARFTDPTWMTVFPKAAGIVTEVGGWLSHAAIQAREYGLTGIVGAMGALDAISTGELVRLNVDGTVERIDERRREERNRAQVQVRVVRASGAAGGRLRDISERGALLVVDEGRLEIGEELSLEIEDGETVTARVVRNGVPHIYGLETETALRS
jgi:phosphohistidine swiveling domain-containing protein